MKSILTVVLTIGISTSAFAVGGGVRSILIPNTGSTSTEGTMVFDSDPRTVTLSCQGGFQAENWWQIKCVTEGSPWATLEINNILDGDGTLHVDGQPDESVACRMIRSGQPNGPVECSGPIGSNPF